MNAPTDDWDVEPIPGFDEPALSPARLWFAFCWWFWWTIALGNDGISLGWLLFSYHRPYAGRNGY